MTFHRWEVLHVLLGYERLREPVDAHSGTRYRSASFPKPNVPLRWGEHWASHTMPMQF